ncbi:MAG: hypothetical protein U0470_13170 [Anaerolineae bacterium]
MKTFGLEDRRHRLRPLDDPLTVIRRATDQRRAAQGSQAMLAAGVAVGTTVGTTAVVGGLEGVRVGVCVGGGGVADGPGAGGVNDCPPQTCSAHAARLS